MAHFSADDEAMLQAMLRQLFQSVKEKITGAPSLECAEEILLHLEETDENFHKYKEMMHSLKNIMMIVVESMINKFEEDGLRSQERQKKIQKEKSNSYCTDNCSDSDSSFSQATLKMCTVYGEGMNVLPIVLQSYKFCQGKLQLILDQLDPGQPKEDRILKFYAQTFTLSPLHTTKEIYTSLAKYLELYFLSRENHIPTLSTGIDITNPNVSRLLKKVRLLNEYQKEAPCFWIRHPEKYMEEIVESTLSLLSVKHDQSHLVSQKILDPIYFLALVDTKAVWFKKWMHAYYSRTAVLRLLEKKYKPLITTAVQQCVQYFELCETMKADEALGRSKPYVVHMLECNFFSFLFEDLVTLTDLLVLFTQLIYYSPSCPKMTSSVHLENYSPANMVTEVLRILCDQKECAIECLYNNTVIEALLQPIHNLMKGTKHVIKLYDIFTVQAVPYCSETALIHIADILARIASVEEGLILLLYGENMNSSEGKSSVWTSVTSLLSERIPTPVEGSDSISSVSQESQNIFECKKDIHTFLFTYFSMAWEENLLDDLLNFAATPKGLLLLQRTGALNECVTFMFSQYAKKLQISRHRKFGYEVLVTQVASTAAGAVALQSSGFINALITELWANLECGRDDVRVTHPRSTPVDPIDRSCQKSFLALVNLLSYPAVYELAGNQGLPNKAEYSLREVPTCIVDIIDRLIILNSEAKIRSLFNYEQSHIFGLR
ncbi:Protein broad-minded [Camelus dromedarius]|uniref:Protein broad-minded n=1 Tax=Camelus dromedarius TaxID=9838 RepID=A0A5N4DWN4_CAMDR|nr:Protein broad-minded [Camelus dromedarius]